MTMVVLVVVGVFTPKNFRVIKIYFLFMIFFKIPSAIWGNDFYFFFSLNKAILELKSKKWTQKSTFFAKGGNRVLTIFGSKNTFSGLFKNGLGAVQELFRHCYWA